MIGPAFSFLWSTRAADPNHWVIVSCKITVCFGSCMYKHSDIPTSTSKGLCSEEWAVRPTCQLRVCRCEYKHFGWLAVDRSYLEWSLDLKGVWVSMRSCANHRGRLWKIAWKHPYTVWHSKSLSPPYWPLWTPTSYSHWTSICLK